MDVDLSELAGFASGLFDWDIEQGGWRAHRLPEPMRRHYAANAFLDIRARCTAGVVLRFRTAAESLRLTVRYGVNSRLVGFGSVVINGVLAGRFGRESPYGEWTDDLSLPGGDAVEVELWFPQSAEAHVMELLADAPLEPSQWQSAGRWLALGDSITQGVDVPVPAETWAVHVARDMNLSLHNAGIGSATGEAALARLLPTEPMDLISVAYGVNDWITNVPVATCAESILAIAQSAVERWPGKGVVVVSPTAMRDESVANGLGQRVQDYRDALAAVRWPVGVRFVPGESIPFDPEVHLFDDCHPNAAGYALQARRLAPHFHAAMQR